MKKIALLLALPAALAAQTVLEGVVVDAVTGNPIAGASVTSDQRANPSLVRSDAAGHFRVTTTNAPMVLVVKAGYLQASKFMPSRNPQDLGQIRIALKPEAVISGKVVDEDGFPAIRAMVQALRYTSGGDGVRSLNGGMVQTDDQGEYRMEKLPAGKYYVHVMANDSANWDRRYAAQYLGGTLEPNDEHAVEVKMGDVHKNADVHLVKIEGVTVSGRVEGGPSDSRTAPPVNLTRTASAITMGVMGTLGPRTAGDNTFTYRHVPPGSYTLHYGNNGPQLHAGDYIGELKLEVGASDLTGIVLTPHPAQPVDVTGQITMREGGPVGAWTIYARQNGQGTVAEINPDGTFVLKGLMPGHHNLQITPDMRSRQSQPRTSPAPHVVTTTLGDQDLKQNGFDLDGTAPKPLLITVSSQYAVLTGTVVDAKGQAVTNIPVIFVSDQPNKRGYANTDEKGAFRAMLAEVGDYRAYILSDQDMMFDEDYLAAHKNDFPPVHAFMGDNAPLALQWKTGAAQ